MGECVNLMNDPYRILNISKNADVEEIKKAYRILVKKYHPDRYQNSSLAKEATEKMKEINQAYDMVMREKQGQGSDASYDNGAYDKHEGSAPRDTYNKTEPSVYVNVRQDIKNQNFDKAESVLNKIPPTERSGEWYYLMSIISYNKGQLEESNNYIETAHSIDPSNTEYYQMYRSIKEQRTGTSYHSGGATGCGGKIFRDICDCFY